MGDEIQQPMDDEITEELGLSSFLMSETHTTALFLIFGLSVLANFMVIILFYNKPALRSFSNRFVVHLSAIHIMHAILVTPYALTSALSGRWVFGNAWCQISGLATLALNMATVLSLLLIAVDRNAAVNSPLHYTMTITKKRTSGLIFSVWILSILSALPPLFGISKIEYRPQWGLCTIVWVPGDLCSIIYSIYLSLVGFIMPFIKMTWIYCSMFRAARSNSERARQHSVNSTTGDPDVAEGVQINCGVMGFSKRANRTAGMRRRSSCGSQSFIFGEEWRAAKTGLIILLSFFVCWFPFFATALSEPWIPEPYTVPIYVPPLVIILSLSASVVNPYIYVFRNRTAKKHLRKFFNCLRRGGRRRRSFRSSNGNSRSQEFPRCPAPGSMTASFRDRTLIWRSMTLSQDGTTVLSNPAIIDAYPTIRENPGLDLEPVRGGKDQTPTTVVVKLPNDIPFEEELISVRSTDGLLLLKMRRLNRDSTMSDSTLNWGSSFESNVTSEDGRASEQRPLMHNTERLLARSSSCYNQTRPPLKRSKTAVEEQELALVPYTGNFVGNILKKRQYSDESSETESYVIGSSMSSVGEIHDTPVHVVVRNRRPKLVRQYSAAPQYPEEEEEGIDEQTQDEVQL